MIADRKQVPARIAQQRNLKFKRDSVFRMNLALGLEPYRHDAVFTQSPLTVKNPEAPWQNATTSALLHRETAVTAFQYPFAMNLGDFHFGDSDGATRKTWFVHLLKAISELNNVAGNHARSYFEMAPASIVVRLSESLVAGYETYGFRGDGTFPEVIEGIVKGDYAGSEFYIGGALVRTVMPPERQKELEEKGAHLYRMAAKALNAAAKAACGTGFLAEPVEGTE